MIDAHTHFNLNADEPASEYMDFLNKLSIEGAVLILNKPEDSEIFWNNEETILNRNMVHVAFLMDINNKLFFERNIEQAEEHNISYSIKLHPRLTNITENDFESIYDYIKELEFRNIIIDSFLYGSKKENFCYIELSTYLAQRLPEKKIVMAHFGGIKVLETMLRTGELCNIFYDCSFSLNYLYGTSAWTDLRHCIDHRSDRVVFGSDRPSFTLEDSEKKLRELMGERSNEFYNSIFSSNARRLYFE